MVVVADVVVVVDVFVVLAMADEDHSGHGHVYGHDLPRLSRDYGNPPTVPMW